MKWTCPRCKAENQPATNDGGEVLAEQVCSGCGIAVDAELEEADMDHGESVIFRHGDVFVTQTRISAGANTYPIAGIASIKGVEIEPNRGFAAFALLIGLPLCFWNLVFGLAVVIPAALYMVAAKSMFAVHITTSAGESVAYSSKDGESVAAIISAVNRAISLRR